MDADSRRSGALLRMGCLLIGASISLAPWNLPLRAQELPSPPAVAGDGVDAFGFAPEDDSPLFTAVDPAAPPAPTMIDTSAVDRNQQRINQLEMQVQSLQQGLFSGELTPGRKRSTDIAPLKPPAGVPTYPTVKLTGFFHADAGWINQDASSMLQFGDIDDSRGFRRARLAAVGDVAKNVSFLLEMDFAQPGRPSFQDLWLDVHDVPLLGNVRVGQWRQPFGMDALTSIRELTFLERATTFAFVPFRQVGIGFHDANEPQNVTWALSAFGFPTDTFGDSIGDSGYGMAGRLTALPYFEDDGRRLVHVGFDYCLQSPTSDQLRYRFVPEFGGPFGGPTGTTGVVPNFVDTGVLDASSSNLFNVELATVNGSFYTQSEVVCAVVNRNSADAVAFPGFYTQAAYLLTGEVRPYNKLAGVLGRIKPRCPWGDGGYGAWEAAARYSFIDLNPGGVAGGRSHGITAGLNWYLNQYTKFQFNYIWSQLNRAPVGDSHANIVAVRAQLDF